MLHAFFAFLPLFPATPERILATPPASPATQGRIPATPPAFPAFLKRKNNALKSIWDAGNYFSGTGNCFRGTGNYFWGAVFFFSVIVFFVAGISHAQTLRPQVALVNPSGGQRGTTATIAITGVNLGYGTQIVIETPGLTVESFAPEAPPANAKNPDGKIIAKIKIAADAPLGRHPFRVMTPLGPSDIGYFIVGEWAEVAEKEPNNNRETAQILACPVTVIGRSEPAEDVDVYRVTMQKGETFVFAAAGGIGSALTPILRLQDAAGQERGFAAALNRPDAVLTFAAPETGDYFLFVRDLRYQGGPTFYYRLTIGRIPGVTGVFPLGGAAGATVKISLTGVNLPTPPERAVALPSEPPLAPLSLPDVASQRLEVGTLPEITETEPNDLPATAPRIPAPATVNGRLFAPASQKPDVDNFRFLATKGQVFALEVFAARLGSPLDAVLTILDGKEKELAANDDARGKDAALNFTAPESGEYIARVADLTNRSGEAFGYRLRIAPAVPDFTLSFVPDCLVVAPGDRVEFRVNVERQNNFDGDIALTVEKLPAGVHFIGTPTIAKGQNAVTFLATANVSAAFSVSPLRVTGTATLGGKTVMRRAQSRERNFVRRDDKIEEATRPVPLPFAVVAAAPDALAYCNTDRLILSVGKTAELKVIVERKAGFTAKIPIIIQGLPANVTVTGAEIPENKNETILLLKAEDKAVPGTVSLTIFARSLVDELRFTDHATLPVALAITK